MFYHSLWCQLITWKRTEVIEEQNEEWKSAIGEKRIGQTEAAIDRRTATNKSKRRASFARRLKRLTCTKETTKSDAWIKNLSYRAIIEKEQESQIKGPNFDVKDVNKTEHMDE